MKKVFFLSVIALSTVLVSCNKTAAPSEEKEAVEVSTSAELNALRTAEALAEYGYKAESASALIEAANILASTPAVKLEFTEYNAGETDDLGGKAEQEPRTPAKMLADAKAMTEDETLLAMAAKVEEKLAAAETAERGAVSGPRYERARVNARDYVIGNVTFYGGQFAEVAVVGDGDTDLDLYVYDENGNFIGSDTDYTDDCYVCWNPRWTGNFIIKVVNRGGVYNNFVFMTN